jgi:DNA primase
VGAIPDAILDEIKRRTDLAAVISEHVALKRSGRGFLGLCPFHQEKTPSFHVDPERGFFHCFGCNAGGNAFTFIMRVTGATFPEVVRTLAAKANVPVPESKSSGIHDRLAEVNDLASQLFGIILRESRLGARGREYMERRGIDAETAQRFQLGFAPVEGWVEKLVKREVTASDLKTLGLASPSKLGRGGMYPLFRDRLMFPIHDLSGRVIGFGGRAVGDVKGPKYLNSPETPLYRKGHHLYGLDVARDAIRAEGRVILVEGYLDAIALAQAGIGNVAAVLGTALTVDQLKLGRRFAEDIVICFDGDEAGRRAALRAFPLCVDAIDLWPRAVFLPAGDDPDSFVRREGAKGFADLVAKAPTLFDFYLDELVGRDAGVGETARAASRMAALLATVQDPIVRDKIVRGVAGRLGVSDAALLEAAQRSRAAGATRAGAGAGGAGARSGAGGPPPVPPEGAPPDARAGGSAPHRGGNDSRGGFRSRGRDGENQWSGRNNGDRREWRGRRDDGRFERPEPLGSGRNRFSAEAELVELILCNAEIAARAASERVWDEFQDAHLKRLAETIVARRTSEQGHFEPTEMLVDLPRGMVERVSRRLASANAIELQRAGDEWFARRAERSARADRQAWIARLRAAEHRRDETQVAAALAALQRNQGGAHAGPASGVALPEEPAEEGVGYELDRDYDDDGRETYDDDGSTAERSAAESGSPRAASTEPRDAEPASHLDESAADLSDAYEPDFDTETGDDS